MPEFSNVLRAETDGLILPQQSRYSTSSRPAKGMVGLRAPKKNVCVDQDTHSASQSE